MEEANTQNNPPTNLLPTVIGVIGVVVGSAIVLSIIPGSLSIPLGLIEMYHRDDQVEEFKVSLPDFVDKDTFVFVNGTSIDVISRNSNVPGPYYDRFFYAKDKNNAYVYINSASSTADLADYQLVKIDGADPITFAIVKVNPDYMLALFPSTDSDYCDNVIDGRTGRTIPPDECRAEKLKSRIDDYASSTVPEAYAKDKNHVYRGTTIVSGADPTSFGSYDVSSGYTGYAPFWESLARDKDRLYFKGVAIDGAYIDSFHLVVTDESDYDTPYAKDDTRVYFWSGVLPLVVVQGADPATFVWLEWTADTNPDSTNPPYMADKNNIYFDGHVVKGADRSSFAVLDTVQPLPKTCDLPQGCYRDAKDKNHSYYKGEVVQ